MNRSSTLAAWLMAALLLGAGLCPSFASAQVTKDYLYTPGAIYTVRTALGITTMIELDASEKVQDYSLGFSSGWDVSRRDNVFYIRPKNVDVDTNLMVRTETHAYIFELKVVATDWKSLEQAKSAGVNYKVVFRYPADSRFTAEVEREHVDELKVGLQPGRVYNFNYEYATRSAATWLIPVRAYDDGKFTYIQLNSMRGMPTGRYPAIYAREQPHEEEFLVNTTVEGDTIVLHGVYPYLVMRQGRHVIGLRRGMAK